MNETAPVLTVIGEHQREQDGRISKRLKNRGANPKQQKYLVNVDDVIATAERVSAAAEAVRGEPVNVQERARQILAARAAKGR